MIRIENISKNFGKLKALDHVNINIKEGRIISIIGPNGSGKTTLIKTILGMVVSNSGSIWVGDEKVGKSHLYRKNIGYMPQIGSYPENMRMGDMFNLMRSVRTDCTNYDTSVYDAFELERMKSKWMRSLSGGTIQKVSAALAFLFNPNILILDEPTAGLDPLSSELLKSKIKSFIGPNKLVIITSHIMSEIDELTDDIAYIQDGKLIFMKEIHQLKKEAGTEKLGQALSILLKNKYA